MFILPTVFSNAMDFVLEVASSVTPPTVATAAAEAKLAATRLLEDFAASSRVHVTSHHPSNLAFPI